MRNLRLELMFNGSAYHGWQRQANADTVQEHIEGALETIFGTHITVYGCSRTDSGVHARQFFCNFHADTAMDGGTVARAVDANTPEDIAVKGCVEMPEDFHSRYSCISKRYEYLIWNECYPQPFMPALVCRRERPLDADKMNEAAAAFVGTHDFAAFCSAGSDVQSTVRTVLSAGVEKDGGLISFTVSADGFLYNMVRIMAGTLIYVGEGRIAPSEVHGIVDSLDRSQAGFTAPAEGLYLDCVYY
ncbi:MAG: tRNA pseudouridine(38-40) synthase TruA [Clostridia bacterium]|nr:tRNA pseudouridine(38-40) synthase TruA [Clostridia bacterium]